MVKNKERGKDVKMRTKRRKKRMYKKAVLGKKALGCGRMAMGI